MGEDGRAQAQGRDAMSTPELSVRSIAPGNSGGMADESDADLLVCMSVRDEDPEGAREAWGVFFMRHRAYVHSICQGAGRGILDDDEVQWVVMETFGVAFKKSESYDAQRCVRAWLGGIARTLMRKALSCRPGEVLLGLDLDNFAHPGWPPADCAEDEPEKIRRTRECFDRLNDREKEVLRTWLLYRDPEHPGRHMPDEEIAGLVSRLNTTSANLRQIRKRALGKVRRCVESNGPGA